MIRFPYSWMDQLKAVVRFELFHSDWLARATDGAFFLPGLHPLRKPHAVRILDGEGDAAHDRGMSWISPKPP